jgi:hypothetical protein
MVTGASRGERGVALIVSLIAIGAAAALGLGLVLASSAERLAASNQDDGLRLLNAAEAALEFAAGELSAVDDWSVVLDGTTQSAWTDGPPFGERRPQPGLVVNLTAVANLATCGHVGECDDDEVHTSTWDRPWGINNPRWRPFLYGTLDALRDPLHRTAPYVLVLVGDDEDELDGDVARDGGGLEAEGRYIIRARAYALAPGGGRRVVEGRLARICTRDDESESCRPGVRVQSVWHVVGGGESR